MILGQLVNTETQALGRGLDEIHTWEQKAIKHQKKDMMRELISTVWVVMFSHT
eukprot:TRINITY_DN4347_c0_g1_i1.p2 TRINITY_DN4347_c0_g1~~TRINITY_DN4347_c0_g1_i1.p2  ORF type:complete len:53 (+),score=11.67 TRINITY_DN4347_c0_g1_i1:42-200(+)